MAITSFSLQHGEQCVIASAAAFDMSLEEVAILIGGGTRDAPAGSCRTVNGFAGEKWPG